MKINCVLAIILVFSAFTVSHADALPGPMNVGQLKRSLRLAVSRQSEAINQLADEWEKNRLNPSQGLEIYYLEGPPQAPTMQLAEAFAQQLVSSAQIFKVEGLSLSSAVGLKDEIPRLQTWEDQTLRQKTKPGVVIISNPTRIEGSVTYTRLLSELRRMKVKTVIMVDSRTPSDRMTASAASAKDEMATIHLKEDCHLFLKHFKPKPMKKLR